jgi:hypothetical protein
LEQDNPWDKKSDAPLWQACINVTGSNLPADKQTIGDCVSHGHSRGMDYLQCVQINMGKFSGQFIPGEHDCYSEAIYGMMRARAHQLSNQDGAVGAWAVESLQGDGYPMRKGRTYDGQKAKLWGARGTPSEIANEGKDFKLAQFTMVTSVDEAITALWNGYPVTICSNQGFTMERNADGIAEAQGSWAHCMVCIGFLMVGGNPIFIILQSWGQNVPSGPTIRGMPDNAFGCRANIFSRILNARDSYLLSSVPGIPAQPINFLV